MILSMMLLLQVGVAAPSQPQNQQLPKPLTALHMRDIGCVATLGLVADEQRRGVAGSNRFPDVTAKGKIYAGIVGDRVVFESGQPKEAVALAIRLSVKDQQSRVIADSERGDAAGGFVDGLMSKCLPLLDAELALAKAPAAQGKGG